MDKILQKSLKKIFEKLIIVFLIQQIVEQKITTDEAFLLIDKYEEEKYKRLQEIKRSKFISAENNRFVRFLEMSQRFRQPEQIASNKGEYKSFLNLRNID
jgi:hypothetical protein